MPRGCVRILVEARTWPTWPVWIACRPWFELSGPAPGRGSCHGSCSCSIAGGGLGLWLNRSAPEPRPDPALGGVDSAELHPRGPVADYLEFRWDLTIRPGDLLTLEIVSWTASGPGECCNTSIAISWGMHGLRVPKSSRPAGRIYWEAVGVRNDRRPSGLRGHGLAALIVATGAAGAAGAQQATEASTAEVRAFLAAIPRTTGSIRTAQGQRPGVGHWRLVRSRPITRSQRRHIGAHDRSGQRPWPVGFLSWLHWLHLQSLLPTADGAEWARAGLAFADRAGRHSVPDRNPAAEGPLLLVTVDSWCRQLAWTEAWAGHRVGTSAHS
jgi:hypothetical protein